MGPPQLQSGGVDTWFAAALDAAKAIMAGDICAACSHHAHSARHSILVRPQQELNCPLAVLHCQGHIRVGTSRLRRNAMQ